MPAPLLECRHLACGYPGRTVLQDVDLIAHAGERIALLGPNGSGKSTLLRTIARLLPASAGSVEIAGDSIPSLTYQDLARRVASVPQEEVPSFAFTVREVVTLGRLAQSNGIMDTEEDRTAAESAMVEADCATLADRPITELSGGERQRVLIARALAQNTPLVLMDEPTSHLDAPHQLAIARLAESLASQGRTVIAAIHDLNLAGLIADRAVLIANGRVVMDAPIDEVLRSPDLDTAYAARFERVTTDSGRQLVIPRPG